MPITAASQRLMNTEATEPTPGFSPASMRRSMPRRNASAAATYCSRENSSVTLIGMPAKMDFLDSRQAFLGSGDLDEQVRQPGSRVQILGRGQRAGRVIGQQRRHFERHPAVHAVGPIVDGPKQLGGAGDVLQRQVEKERLARFALAQLLADRGVVGACCS